MFYKGTRTEWLTTGQKKTLVTCCWSQYIIATFFVSSHHLFKSCIIERLILKIYYLIPLKFSAHSLHTKCKEYMTLALMLVFQYFSVGNKSSNWENEWKSDTVYVETKYYVEFVIVTEVASHRLIIGWWHVHTTIDNVTHLPNFCTCWSNNAMQLT